jgi:predicted dehydrogenase
MKFLIAGFGSIGRRHFRNLKALGERDILLYRSGNSQLDDEELTGYTVERDLAAALAHKPDAVIVANPTALHLDVAIPAAKAGCHLFLEKPISHNLDRLDELETAVKANGNRVLVGFQFRFHPGLQKAAELLSGGKLGHPLSARAHWGSYLPDWHPWEDYRKGYSARANLGGGVLLTLCHPFDYLRWLLGDVSRVWGSVTRSGELEMDVEDQAEVGLEFANGALGSVHLDYLQRPGAHWLQIVCSKGVIHWDADNGSLQVTDSQGKQQEHPVTAGFERNDLFLEQMKHFIEVVSKKAESSCTLKDGRRALEIVLAAYAAAKQGERIDLKI